MRRCAPEFQYSPAKGPRFFFIVLLYCRQQMSVDIRELSLLSRINRTLFTNNYTLLLYCMAVTLNR